MKSDYQPSKDTQTALIKLWELLRNTAEVSKNANHNSQELLDKFSAYENALTAKEREIVELRSANEKLENAERNQSEEILQLMLKIDDLSQSVAEFDAIYKERNSLLQVNNDLEQKNSLLREKANFVPVLSDEIAVLKDEKTTLLDELSVNKLKVSELTKLVTDFSFAQKDISRKNIELNEKINEIQHLKNDYAEAQSVIFALRHQEKELEHAKELIKVLEDTIKSSDDSFREYSNKFENEKIALINSKFSIEEELKESRHIISAHELTISELMGQILQLQNEKNENIIQIHELSNRAEEIDAILLNQGDALTQTSNKLFAIEKDYSDALVQLQEFDKLSLKATEQSEYIELLEEELSGLKEKSVQKDQSIYEAQSTIDLLQTAVENLNNELSSAKAEVLELIESLSVSSGEIEAKEKQVNDLSEKINIMQGKLNVFQSENIELSEEVEKYSILKNKFEILEEEHNRLSKENEYLNEQKRMLSNELAAVYVDKESNAYNLELIEKDLASAKSELNELTDYNVKLIIKQAEAEETQKTLEMISSENSELRSELENGRNEISESHRQIEKLYGEIENLEIARTNLTTANTGLSEEKDRITQEYAKLTATANLAHDIIFEVPSDDRIEELNNKIGKLENSISDKDKKIDKLKSETATLKNKLLNSRNVGLFADLETDRTIILENKVVALELEIEKKDQEIDLLKIKLESPKQSSFASTSDKLIMDLTSEKTLKDMQIANIQRKNDALEELLRTRYEHIKILEKDLDEKTFATKVNNNEKKQLLERVEKIIEVVEAM